MIGKCSRTPENLTIGSHEPVQTGRATPLGTRGSLHTSVLVHIRSCVRLSISLSSPTDGERTHTCPPPTLRENRKDLSAVWPPSPLGLPSSPCCPSSSLPPPHPTSPNAPLLHQPGLLWSDRIPGPDAPGSFSPHQELEPGLSIQSHTSSCLDKAAGCGARG